MCGIIGYAGKNQAAPFILDGLAKLELIQRGVKTKSSLNYY